VVNGLAQGTASVVNGLEYETSSVVVCVRALRIREAINPPLLGEEGSCKPDRDVDIEAELAGCCNCMIYTCWICYNSRDHWR